MIDNFHGFLNEYSPPARYKVIQNFLRYVNILMCSVLGWCVHSDSYCSC